MLFTPGTLLYSVVSNEILVIHEEYLLQVVCNAFMMHCLHGDMLFASNTTGELSHGSWCCQYPLYWHL